MDFIEIYDNAMPDKLCNKILDKFEKSNLKQPGSTGQGVFTTKKNSTDLTISYHEDWKELEKEILDLTFKYFAQYVRKYYFLLTGALTLTLQDPRNGQPIHITPEVISALGDDTLKDLVSTVYHSGTINVQKYNKGVGGYHHWHSEIYPKAGDPDRSALHRVVLFMFYLNNVEEGGETEFFYYQKKCKPTKGQMVIAPAGFTHTHKGHVPVSNDKYIITSWILFKKAEEIFG